MEGKDGEDPEETEEEIRNNGKVVEAVRILCLLSEHEVAGLKASEQTPVHVVVPDCAVTSGNYIEHTEQGKVGSLNLV